MQLILIIILIYILDMPYHLDVTIKETIENIFVLFHLENKKSRNIAAFFITILNLFEISTFSITVIRLVNNAH